MCVDLPDLYLDLVTRFIFSSDILRMIFIFQFREFSIEKQAQDFECIFNICYAFDQMQAIY